MKATNRMQRQNRSNEEMITQNEMKNSKKKSENRQLMCDTFHSFEMNIGNIRTVFA
jgi:hypothetical protein